MISSMQSVTTRLRRLQEPTPPIKHSRPLYALFVRRGDPTMIFHLRKPKGTRGNGVRSQGIERAMGCGEKPPTAKKQCVNNHFETVVFNYHVH